VLEYRRITGDTVRMASEGAFHRSFGHAQAPRAAAAAAGYGAAMPAGSTVAAAGAGATAAASSSSSSAALSSGGVLASRTPAGDAYAGQVEERYRPTRRYRKLQTLWAVPLPPEARVQSCLLEFGERAAVRAVEAADDGAGAEAGGGVGAKGRGGTDFERRFAALQRAARADEETARKAALARERGLLEHMAEAKAGVSGASLGAFVDLQAEELRAAAEGYRRTEEELRALAEGGGLLANTKAGRAAAHARRVGALAKKVESAEEARRGHEAALAAVTAQIEGLRGQLAKAQRYNARAAGEIAKLDATVAALPPEQRAQLKALFDRYTRAESLKDQEARFKASCAAQLADLQARLARLQAEAASGDAARRLAEMTGVHAEAEARLARARAAVAARTREVDRLRRLIDDIPSRGELLQYERRFGELFDEVAEKLDETRKVRGCSGVQGQRGGGAGYRWCTGRRRSARFCYSQGARALYLLHVAPAVITYPPTLPAHVPTCLPVHLPAFLLAVLLHLQHSRAQARLHGEGGGARGQHARELRRPEGACGDADGSGRAGRSCGRDGCRCLFRLTHSSWPAPSVCAIHHPSACSPLPPLHPV
jgi:predicted  nucleic acid-binding Zn-ribbon protein